MAIVQRYPSPYNNSRGAIKLTNENRITVQLFDSGSLVREIVTVVNEKGNSTIQKWLKGDDSWVEDIKIGDLIGEAPTEARF